MIYNLASKHVFMLCLPYSDFANIRISQTDCHVGDDICLHGDTILPPHLDYCLDVNQEAAFVIQRSGLKY